MLHLTTKTPWIPIKFKDLWACLSELFWSEALQLPLPTQHFNPHLLFRQCFGRSSQLTPALFFQKTLQLLNSNSPLNPCFPPGSSAFSAHVAISTNVFFVFLCFSCFIFANPWSSMHPLGKREMSGPCKNHETFLTRGVVLSSPPNWTSFGRCSSSTVNMAGKLTLVWAKWPLMRFKVEILEIAT